MDIIKLFSGFGRRGGTPAIVTAALVSLTLTSVTLTSVTLLSVLLLSCRKGVGAGPGENIPVEIAVQGVVRSVLTAGPLSGATVTLMQHGEPVKTAQTFADGSYVFTGIEASAGYTVSASASIHIESATAEFAVSEIHVRDITLDRDWPTGGTVVAESDPITINGIAAAPDGTIYFTDPDNKIRKIAPGSNTAEDYAGTGNRGVADGSLASATFNNPAGIAVSADGTGVYVADLSGHRVRHITGGQVFTIAGSGSDPGFSGDRGDAKLAQLNHPIGVAADAAGNVYVVDHANSVVRKIWADDDTISTIAGGGGQTQDEGDAVSALLVNPEGITVDIQGNIYITEEHRVRKITPAGRISTVLGTTGEEADLTGFSWPVGIAVDAAGTVYVADSGNHRIVKVLADGTASELAGSYGSGNGQFTTPRYLTIAPDGALYIADFGNQRIIKY